MLVHAHTHAGPHQLSDHLIRVLRDHADERPRNLPASICSTARPITPV